MALRGGQAQWHTYGAAACITFTVHATRHRQGVPILRVRYGMCQLATFDLEQRHAQRHSGRGSSPGPSHACTSRTHDMAAPVGCWLRHLRVVV